MRREELAALVLEYERKGGTITPCPPGNGLGDPALRPYSVLVSFCGKNAADAQTARERIMGALSDGALSIAQLQERLDMTFAVVRAAVDVLIGQRRILARGKTKRRFEIVNTGTGNLTGGPASESAAGACAGANFTHAARPGSIGEGRGEQKKSKAA